MSQYSTQEIYCTFELQFLIKIEGITTLGENVKRTVECIQACNIEQVL